MRVEYKRVPSWAPQIYTQPEGGVPKRAHNKEASPEKGARLPVDRVLRAPS
jgi:hypothetical protein